MRSRIRTAALALLAASVTACGSRGAPLPPVYPNPPAITGLTVAQRGAFAILRFPPPDLLVTVGSEEVELEDVEILVYAERYPVITADMLNAAMERRAQVMRLDAVAEEAAARARAEQEAAAQRAIDEGREPPPPDPDAPPTTVARRSPTDEALHLVPPDILEGWRRQGLAPDAVLAAATRLRDAVDTLWSELNQPVTVIDTSLPVLLPDAGRIAAASEALVERAAYERPLAADAFLGRAAVSRSVPVEQFEELLVDEMLQVAVPVGPPSTGGLRTRYFFAVRGSSTRDTPGQVTAVVPLAPAPVPVAPAEVSYTISGEGVELSWPPPAGDLALRRLAPEGMVYNIYRLAPDGIALPAPLNPQPVSETTYTDPTIQWGESYVYEVRALLAPPADAARAAGTTAGPRRESEGARTDVLTAIDEYPPAPPSDVIATRAGNRVALQWTPSRSIDIVGYRVYRHPLPAPDVPLRFDPEAADDDPAAAAPPAAQAEGAPNPLVAAGWELLTPTPAPFSRHTDTNAGGTTRYAYAVEAIDAAGNLSALAVGVEPGDNDR